jgi:CheY-like chemotaxis protein
VCLKVTHKNTEKGKCLAFEVSDSGIGMSQETISKVCQPFEQADQTIHAKFGGTGLGLAITKRLVALFGGNLAMKSEFGKGTSVFFEIPVKRVEVKENTTIADLAREIDTSQTLIVDDISTNRMVLDQMLKRFEVPRRQAKSGSEAVQLFREQRPDLVLLDLQMPDMDGYEVLREIRQIEAEDVKAIKKARVVAVTGQAYSDTVSACLQAGFDAHLAKPVSLQRLGDVLRGGGFDSSYPPPEDSCREVWSER